MPQYDLSSPEFVSNPYPTYQKLHQHAPVYYCEERGFYYVSRYEHVKALFRDPRASSNRIKPMANALPEAVQSYAEPLISCLEKWVLFLDAPEHTKIRRVINPSFSSKVVAELEPRIRSIADQLISQMLEQDSIDLIASFAYPLPVMVIAEMLGCPAEDRDNLKRWSDQIAHFLGNKTTLESAAKARESIIEATGYFQDIVSEQKKTNRSPLLESLIEFQKNNPEFTDDHLVANVIALIFAGHETTTNLIGNACYHMLLRAEAGNRIRIDDFIEEVLRFESPVQRMGRFSIEDIEIDGHHIPKGHRILLMLGAANRDGVVYEQPDSFDPDRKNRDHLAFGFGHHLCSGSQVARTESAIALERLFREQYFKLEENHQPEWQYNLGLRALKRLSVYRN